MSNYYTKNEINQIIFSEITEYLESNNLNIDRYLDETPCVYLLAMNYKNNWIFKFGYTDYLYNRINQLYRECNIKYNNEMCIYQYNNEEYEIPKIIILGILFTKNNKYIEKRIKNELKWSYDLKLSLTRNHGMCKFTECIKPILQSYSIFFDIINQYKSEEDIVFETEEIYFDENNSNILRLDEDDGILNEFKNIHIDNHIPDDESEVSINSNDSHLSENNNYDSDPDFWNYTY